MLVYFFLSFSLSQQTACVSDDKPVRPKGAVHPEKRFLLTCIAIDQLRMFCCELHRVGDAIH